MNKLRKNFKDYLNKLYLNATVLIFVFSLASARLGVGWSPYPAPSPLVNSKKNNYFQICLWSYVAGAISGKMKEVLGTFSVPLEGRFCKIRTEETNLGNWICDILLAATGADLVIVNSGTFRSDETHPPGDFTLGDLMRIVPRSQPTVELNVTGTKMQFNWSTYGTNTDYGRVIEFLLAARDNLFFAALEFLI